MGDRSAAERVVFDLRGLHAARARSRAQAAREIGVALATTLRTARGALEADGVLAMVHWRCAAPERLVLPPPAAPGGSVPQGRCDTRELHRLLDRCRRERGLTWAQVAATLGAGVAPGRLTRLAGGSTSRCSSPPPGWTARSPASRPPSADGARSELIWCGGGVRV